jgi:GTP-binding protein
LLNLSYHSILEYQETLLEQFNHKARFICSAGQFHELPTASGKEFAICGRSNVGKSSFINHQFNDHALARTSKRPGTTLCANFYQVDEDWHFVDLPGYGFARTARNEKERWSNLIRDYCQHRENCCGIVWLVDIRHVDTSADTHAYAWFQSLSHKVFPVLTKADKLSNNEKRNQCMLFKKTYTGVADPMLYSVNDPAVRLEFWEKFEVWKNHTIGV